MQIQTNNNPTPSQKISPASMESLLAASVFSDTIDNSWQRENNLSSSDGYAYGITLNKRKMGRATTTMGPTAIPVAVNTTTYTGTLQQFNTSTIYNAEVKKYFYTPEMRLALARQYIGSLTQNKEIISMNICVPQVWNVANLTTIDTPITSSQQAGSLLTTIGANFTNQNIVANDPDRFFLMNPTLYGQIVGSLITVFNPAPVMSGLFTKGIFGRNEMYGLTMGISPLIPSQQWGSQTQAALGTCASVTMQNGGIHAQGATGTLTLNTNLTGTIMAGQSFIIPGIYACQPTNKATAIYTGGSTAGIQVVCTTTAPSGQATIQFSPPLIYAGNDQNCMGTLNTALAPILPGTANKLYQTSIAYHRRAFALIQAPYPKLEGLDSTVMTKGGSSITTSVGSDILSSRTVLRWDMLSTAIMMEGWDAQRILS